MLIVNFLTVNLACVCVWGMVEHITVCWEYLSGLISKTILIG